MQKLVGMSSVQFPNDKMYEAFEKKTKNDMERNSYVIFDENNKTVWICWCDGGLIR